MAMGTASAVSDGPRGLIWFPDHSLLIVEERLREEHAEGVMMPEEIGREELALRVLVAADIVTRGSRSGRPLRGARVNARLITEARAPFANHLDGKRQR
jgi:hypothetical protein